VSAIKISAECRRMGALAHHIGTAARRSYPVPAIPDELSRIFRRMGDVASRIADGAGVTLKISDAQDAARLEVDDDAMDGLRRALFRALVDDWSHGVETAVNVALLGRYYERFADHAVAIAQSVIFIVTGAKPEDRAHHVG
jgi:phosphate transport system protein